MSETNTVITCMQGATVVLNGITYHGEEGIKSLIDSFDSRITTQKKINDELREDMRKIAVALLDEASEREWCDEYNNFVDNVNDRLTVHRLYRMEKEYEVTVDLKEVRTATVKIMITASSEDEAKEQVEDMDIDDIESNCVHGFIDWYADDSSFDVTNVEDAY